MLSSEEELEYRKDTVDRIQSILSSVELAKGTDIDWSEFLVIDDSAPQPPCVALHTLMYLAVYDVGIIKACSLLWERHIKNELMESIVDDEMFRSLSYQVIDFIHYVDARDHSPINLDGSDEFVESMVKFIGAEIIPWIHVDCRNRLAQWACKQARRTEALEKSPFKAYKITAMFKFGNDHHQDHGIARVQNPKELKSLRDSLEKLRYLHECYDLKEASLEIFEHENADAPVSLSLSRAVSVEMVLNEIEHSAKPIANALNINLDRCIADHGAQMILNSSASDCDCERLAIEFTKFISDSELRAKTVLTIATKAQAPFSINVERSVKEAIQWQTSYTGALGEQLQLMEIRKIVVHHGKDEKMQINLTDAQQGRAVVMFILGKATGDDESDDKLLLHSFLIGQAYRCIDREQILINYIENLGLLLGGYQREDRSELECKIRNRLDSALRLVNDDPGFVLDEVTEFCTSLLLSLHDLMQESGDDSFNGSENGSPKSKWQLDEIWGALTMGTLVSEVILQSESRLGKTDTNTGKSAKAKCMRDSFVASKSLLQEFDLLLSPKALYSSRMAPDAQERLSSLLQDHLNKGAFESASQIFRFGSIIGLDQSRACLMLANRALDKVQSEPDVSRVHQLCVESLELAEFESENSTSVVTQSVQDVCTELMKLFPKGMNIAFLCDIVMDLLARCLDQCPIEQIASIRRQLKEMALIKSSLELCDGASGSQGPSAAEDPLPCKHKEGTFVEQPNLLNQKTVLAKLGRFLLDTRSLHHLKDAEEPRGKLLRLFPNLLNDQSTNRKMFAPPKVRGGASSSSAALQEGISKHEKSTEALIEYLSQNGAMQLSLLAIGFIDFDAQSSADQRARDASLKELVHKVLNSDAVDSSLALGCLLELGGNHATEIYEDIASRVNDDFERLSVLSSIGIDLGKASNQKKLLGECLQAFTDAIWFQKLSALEIPFDHLRLKKPRDGSRDMAKIIAEMMRKTGFDADLALDFANHFKFLSESQVLCLLLEQLLLEEHGGVNGRSCTDIERRIIGILSRIAMADLKKCCERLLSKIDGKDYRALTFMFQAVVPHTFSDRACSAAKECERKTSLLELLDILCGPDHSGTPMMSESNHQSRNGKVSFHELWSNPWGVLDSELSEENVNRWAILSGPLEIDPDEFYIRMVKKLTMDAARSDEFRNTSSLTVARLQQKFFELVDNIQNPRSALSLIEWICAQKSVPEIHKLQLKKHSLRIMQVSSNGSESNEIKNMEDDIKHTETMVDLARLGSTAPKLLAQHTSDPYNLICQLYHMFSSFAAESMPQYSGEDFSKRGPFHCSFKRYQSDGASHSSSSATASLEPIRIVLSTQGSLLHEVVSKIAARYDVNEKRMSQLPEDLVRRWMIMPSESPADNLVEFDQQVELEERKMEMRIVYVLLHQGESDKDKPAKCGGSNSANIKALETLLKLACVERNARITFKARTRAFRACYRIASHDAVESAFQRVVLSNDAEFHKMFSLTSKFTGGAGEFHKLCGYMGEIEDLRMQQTMNQLAGSDKLGLVRGMLKHFQDQSKLGSKSAGTNENANTNAGSKASQQKSLRVLRMLRLLSTITFSNVDLARNIELVQDILAEMECVTAIHDDMRRWVRSDLAFWSRTLKHLQVNKNGKYSKLKEILTAMCA